MRDADHGVCRGEIRGTDRLRVSIAIGDRIDPGLDEQMYRLIADRSRAADADEEYLLGAPQSVHGAFQPLGIKLALRALDAGCKQGGEVAARRDE